MLNFYLMVALTRIMSAVFCLLWCFATFAILPFVPVAESRLIILLIPFAHILFFTLAFTSTFRFSRRQLAETGAFFALITAGSATIYFGILEQEPFVTLAILPLILVAVLWFKATDRIFRAPEKAVLSET